jgi:penicillin-binding protein 1A
VVWIRSPLEAVPAAVLGVNSVTAMDMASAYSTFANRGVKVAPVLVTRITRADGTVLFQHQHSQEKVLEAGVADTLTSILEQVIERGTGTKAKLDRPAAGKTGTADDWKDAWFAGYTPDRSTAVWVGFPQLGANDQQIPMAPPHTPIRVTGGSYPAQIWQQFMSAALAGRPPLAFTPPTTTTTTAPPSQLGGPATTVAVPLVVVPDVVGAKAEEAANTLSAAGFVVERIPAREGAKPPDRVMAQSPPGGTEAPQGSTVRIEVSGDPSG